MRQIDIRNLIGTAGQLSLDVPHLQFHKGTTTCVIGSSGSGKSLCAAALSGLPMPGLDLSADISLDGQPCQTPLWREHVFVLPQEPAVALDPTMAVGLQLAEVFRWRRDASYTLSTPAVLSAQVGLDTVDLEKVPDQLSGGMQQRIMIAMALAARASFIVADEPTKGLDNESKTQVIDLFKKLKGTGRGLIIITHDLDVAEAMADDIVVFDQGKVVEIGPTNQVLRTPHSNAAKTLIECAPKHWADRAVVPVKTANPIVSLENVTFGFPNASHTLSDVNLSIHSGEIVGLCGPSGVGKSTLANLCLGLHKPMAGFARWFGDPLTPTAIRHHRTKFQKLFQNPVMSFPPNLSLVDAFEKLSPDNGNGAATRADLMHRLKLNEALLERRPDQVSGGELQRLAIVRVLLAQPRFLVCDEPSSRLDMSIQKLAIDTITDYAAETNTAVLLISHDIDVLQKRAERVIVLRPGGVLQGLEVEIK